MPKCWNCGYNTDSQFNILKCSECGEFGHVLDQNLFPIPVVNIGENLVELKNWQGFGPHLIEEIRNDPLRIKSTRIGVLEKLLNVQVKQNKNKRENILKMINSNLGKYSLEFHPFEINLKTIFDTGTTTMSQFRSSPGLIKLVGDETPNFGINISDSEDKTLDTKNQNPLKNDSDWIFEQLKKMYPKQHLFDQQIDAITHSVENPGSLTSVVLPTGKGKTRIAQALAISQKNGHGTPNKREGPILILYPTISLMDDQKKEWSIDLNNDLERAGLDKLNVRVLHSGEDKEEVESTGADLISGKIDVLICSPESLTSRVGKIGLLEIAMRLKGDCDGLPFSALVIDEVHILYDWGDSIRDAYLYIDKHEKMLRKINPNLRTILLTATLTPREEDELIINKFERQNILVSRVRDSSIRPDLGFTVISDYTQKIEDAAELIWREYAEKRPYESKSPLLIYTFRPKDCDTIAKHLRPIVGRKNIGIYSGKTSNKGKRKRILEKFQNNQIKLLIATSAFGMGVNKSDVWMIGYVGMPGTLRELYQSFGRAARGSGWGKKNALKRNGNCIAIISGKRMTSYQPTLGPAKAIERILPMIKQGVATTNGYFLFKISPSNHIFWNPFDEINYRNDAKRKSRLADHIAHKFANGVPQNKQEELEEIWWKNQYQGTLNKRKNEEYSKLRKAAIYLEEADTIKIEAVLPFEPLRSPKHNNIIDIIENGGIDGIIDAYSDIKFGSQTTYNQSFSDLVIIAKINQNLNSFTDIYESVESGNKKLETWARGNQTELERFLKAKNSCLRIGFLPAVGGLEEDENTCEEIFWINEKNPLDDGVDPEIPCSVCRNKLWLQDPIHAFNSNLRFNGKPPYGVWLNDDGIDYLAGRKNLEQDNSKSYREINRLPGEYFHLGFLIDEDDYRINTHSEEIKQSWIELIKYNSEPLGRNKKKIVFESLFDINGNELEGSFSIDVEIEHGVIFNTFSFDDIPKAGYPYGGIIFIENHKIHCRLVDRRGACAAFRELKKDVEGLEVKFIGKSAPDIHGDRLFRSWKNV